MRSQWGRYNLPREREIYIYMHITINHKMHGIYGGFLSHGGNALSLDGLFHGKSQSKMDDLGVPPWLGNRHITIKNELKLK